MKTITQKLKINGLLLILFIISTNTDAQNWNLVGSENISGGNVTFNDIKVDNNNVPYVVYRDHANFSLTTVKKFNGTSWELVGTAGFGGAGGADTDQLLVFDNNNTPYVSIREGIYPNESISVLKFNGTAWVYVGNQKFAPLRSGYSSIAIDNNNVPYVSYSDGTHSFFHVTVKKFNGTSWETVGNIGTKGFFSKIKFDSSNTPYLAYRDDHQSNKMTVRKFTNGNWNLVGSAGFSDGSVNLLQFEISDNNTLFIAFQDGSASSRLTVMKFNGTNWENVGVKGFSNGGGIQEMDITSTNDNQPIVIYSDTGNGSKTHVKQFYKTSWEELGNVNLNTTYNNITITSNNKLYISYRKSSAISVKSFDIINKPILNTTDASSITKNSGTLAGNITNEGDSSVTERGIVYSSTDTTPEIGEAGVIKDTNGTGTGVFTENIIGLINDTKYYYNAYAINTQGTGYGVVKNFTTLGVKVTSIERKSPSEQNLYASAVTFKVTFSKPVKNVDVTDFTTNNNGATISNVTQVSTSVYDVTVGNITILGDVFLQLKGVNSVLGSNDITTLTVAAVPNTTVNQTVNNDYFNQAKIGQTYTVGANGILKKVTFYPEDGQHNFTGTANLKIYSGDETNGGTEIYSEQINITNSTTAAGQAFTLATPQNVNQGNTYSIVLTDFSGSGYAFSASKNSDEYAGGHIIFTGFNASSHASIDLKIKIEEETNALPGDITLSTTAPITNEKYIKIETPSLPTLTTTTATAVTTNSATLAGNIINQGESAITERGIVYSTIDTKPKIGDTGVTKNDNGTGTGVFTENITGLTANTTYYYSAYATNTQGTAYGDVKRFSLNNALNFDGTNDRITIADNAAFNFSSGFTAEAWIKPDVLGTQTYLSQYASGQKAFAFILLASGKIEFTVTIDGSSDQYFESSTAITAGTWSHVALTFDGTTVRAYINGVAAGTNAVSGTMFASTAPIEIGARNNAHFFNGTIDEVRIWTRVLTEAEILAQKDGVLPSTVSGLAAYYKFNQGTADGDNSGFTHLFDFSSNSLHGAIENFTKDGATSNFVTGVTGNFSNTTMATNTFATTGNWSTASNWSLGIVPTQVDKVTIGVGKTVTINVDNLKIDDFTLENTAVLNIPKDKGITIQNSFVSSGSLELGSDKNDSGVLLVEGTTSGNVTYKRGGLLANEWYIVTPPITGQTVKSFAENAANDIRINTTPDPDRYAIATYDDTLAAGSKWVYYDADVNATDEFIAGQSYSMSRATDGEVTFTGTLAVDDLIKTMIAGQWNAIGNPFTTYYPANKNSSSSFLNDNIGVLDANFPSLYIWDDTQSKYVAVTELDASNRSLPPGQGFFVKMKAGETEVSFNEAKRSTKPSSGDTDFQKTTQQPSITLQVSNGKTTVATDIKYFKNATTGFDTGFEIGNFNSTGLDIYTRLVDKSNSINYTIQSLPSNNYENMIVPIGIKAKKGDEVSFSATYTNLPNGVDLYLEDKLQNLFIKLNDATQNEIKVVFENDVNDIGRFYLHTSSKSLSVDNINTLNNISMYTSNKVLKIKGLEENASIKMYSVLGKMVLQTELNTTERNEISLSKFSEGIYIVYLQTENEKLSKKITLK